MNFEAFVQDIQENDWNVFGVEVYVDGKPERQYGDTVRTRYPIYSATKAITSIAVGMAADEGRLDVEKPVLAYLPGEVTDRLPQEQRELYRRITVRRLLTMSVAGYPFRPHGESWLEAALRYPIADAGKPEFDYSNIPAYLAGVAVACAIGEDVYQYLNRRLFEPLHIANPPYARCPDGYFYGASSMELSVNELSRIGLLFYRGGTFEDRRILSEAYVREATSVQQMNREGGYGYFLWKYRDGFSINGKWGQKCFVLPEEKVMVTYLSHMEEDSHLLKESMEKHILGGRG